MKQILALKFLLQKSLPGVNPGGGVRKGSIPPAPAQNIIGLKTSCIILYMLENLHTKFKTLAPSLHLEKFVVGGWVCKPILVISLGPSPSSG